MRIAKRIRQGVRAPPSISTTLLEVDECMHCDTEYKKAPPVPSCYRKGLHRQMAPRTAKLRREPTERPRVR